MVAGCRPSVLASVSCHTAPSVIKFGSKALVSYSQDPNLVGIRQTKCPMPCPPNTASETKLQINETHVAICKIWINIHLLKRKCVYFISSFVSRELNSCANLQTSNNFTIDKLSNVTNSSGNHLIGMLPIPAMLQRQFFFYKNQSKSC